ncbi:hypothetical protein QZH41_016344 [Actinostola sp. cb2023]|nr:hypothetical protein QZH41_016344 [Actinostola sp. cb2023]
MASRSNTKHQFRHSTEYRSDITGDKLHPYLRCFGDLHSNKLVECLKTLVAQPVANRKCPICRGEVDRNSLPINVDLLAVMSSIPAKCTLCAWEGRVEDVMVHSSMCSMKGTPCVFPGCSLRCLRKDMPEHKRACSFRTVTCNECFDIVALRNIENHKLEQCSYRKLPCPFYGNGHDAHNVAWHIIDNFNMTDELMIMMKTLFQGRKHNGLECLTTSKLGYPTSDTLGQHGHSDGQPDQTRVYTAEDVYVLYKIDDNTTQIELSFFNKINLYKMSQIWKKQQPDPPVKFGPPIEDQ